MYNHPYFIPGYFAPTAPSIMRGAIGNTIGRTFGSAMGNTMNGARLASQGASRGLGLFNRLGSSMNAIKNINWGSLITNTSKTLNVVNQAIPLVRQVGPMVNNMKSVLRVASLFKDETDNKAVQKRSKSTNQTNYNKNNNYTKSSNNTFNLSDSSTITDNKKKNNYSNFDYYDNSPTFFINS